MRIRARHVHAFETLFDNVVGYAMNVGLVWLFYVWLLGHEITMTENLGVGVAMFIIAWARKYSIRRWSNNFIGNLYERYKAEEDAAQLQEQAGES